MILALFHTYRPAPWRSVAYAASRPYPRAAIARIAPRPAPRRIPLGSVFGCSRFCRRRRRRVNKVRVSDDAEGARTSRSWMVIEFTLWRLVGGGLACGLRWRATAPTPISEKRRMAGPSESSIGYPPLRLSPRGGTLLTSSPPPIRLAAVARIHRGRLSLRSSLFSHSGQPYPPSMESRSPPDPCLRPTQAWRFRVRQDIAQSAASSPPSTAHQLRRRRTVRETRSIVQANTHAVSSREPHSLLGAVA